MTTRALVHFLAVIVLLASACVAADGRPETIEVRANTKTYTGRIVAHDADTFWMMQRDGRLVRLPINAVKQFHKVSPRFRPYSAREVRDLLRKEFGAAFEVVGTRHYLVVAPKGHGRDYAGIFEGVCRRFITHFGAAGFRLDKLRFPLVAVVFPNKRQFLEYAKTDGVKAAGSILGYYHPHSNRVAVYDTITVSAKPRLLSRNAGGSRRPAVVAARPGGPGARLRGTIVHETTHQVAFNTGLHSRIGATPRWVSEGLATMFEARGIRERTGGRGAGSRINAKWLHRFRELLKRRQPRSLSRFLASDQPFRATMLDAYAEGWALTFFLAETRSAKYARYLRGLAARDPLKPYPAPDRLKDFQAAFGDVDRLEVAFLRFIGGLNGGER